MAREDAKLFSSYEKYIKTTEEFMLNVKNKLKWNKLQWTQAGENGSRMQKLCNSLHYWKGKLKPALDNKSVIITVFNTEKDVKTNLLDIITAVEQIGNNIHIQGFSDFRNPRYLCLHFKTEEEKQKVEKDFRMLNENFIVYLSWALEDGPPTVTLKVHWLPMTLNLEVIKKELNSYVQFIEEKRYVRNFMDGREFQSGKVIFKVAVNKDIKVEDIPHLMNIAQMEALITVSGRDPLCLNCNNMGHISRECKLRYCNSCHEMKAKTHQCIEKQFNLSYAAVLKQDFVEIDPDDWGAAVVVQNPNIDNNEQTVIRETITKLEKQISRLDAEDNSSIQRRMKNKRKSRVAKVAKSDFQTSGEVRADNAEEEELSSSASDEDPQSEDGKDDSHMNSDSDSVDDIKVEKKVCMEAKLKVGGERAGVQQSDNIADCLVRDEPEVTRKTYGKSTFNSGKDREDRKFNRLLEKREFVFDD